MDYQYQAVEQPSNPRKTWPIVLSVVVALTVACGAGVYVYHAKQQEALASCRQSVAEFSAARKAILDTSDNSSELQKVLRDVLGVDDILDAFADAATSAEGTVDVEGCKANATITQLNLVSKTLDSATDSLNGSLKTIEKNQQSQSGGDTSDGTSIQRNPMMGRVKTSQTTMPNRWKTPNLLCRNRLTRQTRLSTNSAMTAISPLLDANC